MSSFTIIQPLWFAIFSIISLIMCFSLIITSFKAKKTHSLFIGVIVGIAGFVLAVISLIKSIRLLNFVSQVNVVIDHKGQLITAIVIDFIFIILIVAIFTILIWLFKGYRHGL